MLEKFLYGVMKNGLKTKKPVDFSGSSSVKVPSGIQIGAIGFYAGTGAPAFTAPKGSIYSRTDGSSISTRLYVNTDGATGWTSVTTAT